MQYLQYLGEMEPKIRMQYFMDYPTLREFFAEKLLLLGLLGLLFVRRFALLL